MEQKKTAKSVKEQIKIATVALLQKKSYLDITVTDIATQAGIARVSFYRNYPSIADVYDDIVEGVFAELTEEVLPVLKGNDEGSWRALLYYMFYRFPKHHSVEIGQHGENAAYLFTALTSKLQVLKNESTPQTLGEKYIGFGKIGLVVNIIKQWMAEGQKETPEEMVNFIMGFITTF